MTGCEACSALVNQGDTHCAICGAELQGGAAGGSRKPAPPPRVHIPVRRYGKAPPPPRTWRVEQAACAGRPGPVIAAALGVAILAGCLAAWWPFG
ncbi:hypothetical protein PE066_07225 [Ramlibacter tataouinensis]|uniref:hypothetical protein n=1 Tax=Ramlibacter tataouinensis TaxID=94132 RepID=UPI0022F3E8B4|nr:hypothetical protein [Ramlibacter tataouinensis]WBY03317.1 hypothetical protein PE066_07225 [Ramlibacter tataouinensis]